MNQTVAGTQVLSQPQTLRARPEKLRIGDVLLKQNLISERQLQQTLELQKKPVKSLDAC
jgi:hypothetical protein